jgi:GT2 family glycosyltransferase
MLLRPSRRTQASRILELGVSISHTGRRELGLEPGEVAQGQHEPADTLGVSTCGMLVRRSTYEALGGFDEAVPLFRDGVEFGWRATLAGHRVVTCPAARITHRQAGRLGRRTGSLAEAADGPGVRPPDGDAHGLLPTGGGGRSGSGWCSAACCALATWSASGPT